MLGLLSESGFTLKDIASFVLLPQTIQRSIAEFGLQGISSFTDISQANPDEIAHLYTQEQGIYMSFQAFFIVRV